MSNTMVQFKEVLKDILKLENKQQMMRSMFEESTSELSECFHWIMEAGLHGRKHTSITIHTCPELYAKELKGMGFTVKEKRNCGNILCGYDIEWD